MKCKDCKNLKNRSTYGQCYAHEDCKICKDSDDGCIMFESIVQHDEELVAIGWGIQDLLKKARGEK